ncbi:unnamed protein product [Lactuca virosa]|uniref:RING-type E3 ubiquitin transferase n=1 Tax=Lactuca virosa TaxID=75947 RepID=A0AAU9MVV4_9ASTR|nr:unnamed protein product [Lactuca virosa]
MAVGGGGGELVMVEEFFVLIKGRICCKAAGCPMASIFSLVERGKGNAQRRRLRDTNLDGNDPSLQFQSRGLDSFAVQMIPVTQFKKKIESDKVNHCDESTECSICLGEYEDDDWVKTIPNCSHVFHVSCIDTWFQTHSNCPLCRSDIFDLEVSVSTCGSRGNLIREEVDEERSVFYQTLRSHILQNSNFARLDQN